MPEGTSPRQATDAEVVQSVSNWLIEQGLKSVAFESIIAGFSERLVAAGVPLKRGIMAMRTLHPSVDAQVFYWRAGEAVESERYEIDQREQEGWLRSPMRHMLVTRADTLRRRLQGPEARIDFPVLEELQAQGLTDYYARIVPFEISSAQREENGLISSWATAALDGFSDSDIAVLDRLIPRLALTAKATLTREIAETVLDTYVGPDAGRRIMSGDIRRGALDVIRAVVVYADLRGFTRITNRLERDRLAAMLDAYFERSVPPIQAHGGQVLKFIGDGMLATFNLEGRPKDAVCGEALAAAQEMIGRVRDLNRQREPAGEPVMTLDIAMHLGDVLYGNVGAADRLDFTVIGPAVNEANRIEALCEPLGHELLISEAFAKSALSCAGRLIPVGRHELRGIRGTQALYTVETG